MKPSAMLAIMCTTVVQILREDGRNLNLLQLAILLTVYAETERFSVRDLAERLAADKSTISRSIDRLVEFGLIRRHEDNVDRRLIYLTRTTAGSTMFRRVDTIATRSFAEAAAAAA